MQQRYYDPVAGRFLSIDPVTTDANTGGSFNRYVYASNSPYRYIDPDGRADEPVIPVVTITAPRPPPPATPTVETSTPSPFMAFFSREPTQEQIAGRALSARFRDGPIEPLRPECMLAALAPACTFNDIASETSPGAIPTLGAVKGVKGVRRKPGSLGQPKGTDALRRENEAANAVDAKLGLKNGETHKEISGQGLSGYSEILTYMRELGYGH